jgi:hypothetical protein
MDNIPQELIYQICGYLSAEDLRSTYYVSTTFRDAAEDHASEHRTKQLETTDQTKQSFLDDYCGFRLRFVKRIRCKIQFPELTVNGRCYRDKKSEKYIRGTIFTAQIRNIFKLLKTTEDRAGARNYGKYELIIECNCAENTHNTCVHAEQAQWRTHLLTPATLPNLMSVQCLDLQNTDDGGKLDYRILIDLASHLPNLKGIVFHTGTNEWPRNYAYELENAYTIDYDGVRRDTRHGFSKAITATQLPTTLRRVTLNFLCYGDADEVHNWKSMPNLVSPAAKDPFSSSLRILSYHLREMRLSAQVDETLFWPEDDSVPVWPHLQDLFIKFHVVAPSGSWYFQGPRGEGGTMRGHGIDESSYPSDNEDLDCINRYVQYDRGLGYSFRVSPNDEILNPFLVSFAKAAANMPQLRQAVLWSHVRWELDGDDTYGPEAFDYFEAPWLDDLSETNGDLAWGLAYNRPRLEHSFATNPGERNCEARQIWWKVGNWRPDPDLHKLLQRIGQRQHSEALKEYWGDDESGKNLASLYCFRPWMHESYIPSY